MHIIKRRYVDTMQGLGGLSVFGGDLSVQEETRSSDPYGWQRWFSSLFAIYDTDRMIALDLPWWNVEATREISDFLAVRGNARIFEYGSGASTVWLAKRCGEIITVEHDKPWLDTFQRQTKGHNNVSLLYRPIDNGPDGYVKAIDEFDGEFDMIVVDGRHRSACLRQAESRLKKGGIVLFDDSGRARYRDAIEGSALVETRHYGRSYCVPYPDYTSLMRHGER